MTQALDHPGHSLGLPESGRGALAPWRARVSALVIDWGASMAVAVGAFGGGVFEANTWRSFMILAVFFVQKALLTAFTGSSFGQLITGVGIRRTDGSPVGLWRAVVRSAMVCLVLPAVVVGPDRRGLDDLALGTVVVNRR
ncbi:RDD family protein [Propioniciclava coleopterorum]|uniref:RDD family protein n=1 Tax=Propioniciclava coleopterorum TaxID=2714937 RepID=A0A6G7Y7T1_9ACTN|nr:RDD family protein [Propioniciclava coleopterorum]QIK72875.1 RDD family protein [Propioniciclava coleopterorum]